MSRGVPHILPDSPPPLRYGKVLFLPENEDLMVMDTKLKIIEILQVSGTSICSAYHHCCIFFPVLDTFFVNFVSFWQFILSVRLDYRITYLLSIYKKAFGDRALTDSSMSLGDVPPITRETFLSYRANAEKYFITLSCVNYCSLLTSLFLSFYFVFSLWTWHRWDCTKSREHVCRKVGEHGPIYWLLICWGIYAFIRLTVDTDRKCMPVFFNMLSNIHIKLIKI